MLPAGILQFGVLETLDIVFVEYKLTRYTLGVQSSLSTKLGNYGVRIWKLEIAGHICMLLFKDPDSTVIDECLPQYALMTCVMTISREQLAVAEGFNFSTVFILLLYSMAW